MAEAYLASDTEQSLPGDHAMLAARWPLGDDSPKPWTRLDFGRLMDIDLLGPAMDLARPAGDRAPSLLRLSGTERIASASSSCGKSPGTSEFTRIPYGPHSTARVSVRFFTPAFAAAECAKPGPPVQA